MQHKFDIIIPPQDIAYEPDLQERLAEGDREAFEWVYKNYCKRVYSYALLVTGDERKSVDIVQDVFLRLWKFREKIRGIENFNGYMNIKCRNQVMNELWDEGRERKYYFESLAVSGNEIDDIINFRETYRIKETVVKELPVKQRQILELREEGIKRPEIAKLFGVGEFAVKGQVNRGIRFFKERLAR